jgi:hypothetical protein
MTDLSVFLQTSVLGAQLPQKDSGIVVCRTPPCASVTVAFSTPISAEACCACAMSGQPSAAPLRSVMKSRRLNRSIRMGAHRFEDCCSDGIADILSDTNHSCIV